MDFSEHEIETIRAATPGVTQRIHMNNAGAALMPQVVVGAMIDHIQHEASIGGYEAHAVSFSRTEAVYDSVARLIGAARDEISLAENATLAWQRVFYSLRFLPGDRILTTTAEFAANYVAYLQTARKTGARVEIIPDDASGALDPIALEKMIDEKVKLIAVTWVPSNGGLVNPAAGVGRIARAHNIPYLLDACQAAGQIPIDVAELGCDMLTATGRKFLRAPRGTGFLYVRREFLQAIEPAFIDLFGAPWVGDDRYELRPDARRFETWEANYTARLGLGAAIDFALSVGLRRIEQRCRKLSGDLRSELAKVPGIVIRDLGVNLASIVSFTHDTLDAKEIMAKLTAQGINVSVSPPATTPVDSSARRLPSVVRVSPHYYNTPEEIADTVAAIRGIVTTTTKSPGLSSGASACST